MFDEATLVQLVTMLKIEVRQDLIIKTLIESQLLSQKELDDVVKVALDSFSKKVVEIETEHQKALDLKRSNAKSKEKEAMDKMQDEILANLPRNKTGNA